MIWAYLDGTCSAEERRQVQELLASDQDFREAFKKSELLHQQLLEVEVEMPSMRFTQNVMDKLPAVTDLATAPLVSKKWMQSFGWILSSLLLVFWGGSALIVQTDSAVGEEAAEVVSLLEWIARLSARGTSGPLFFAGLVIVSLLCLFLLDRWLQVRFGRLKHQ